MIDIRIQAEDFSVGSLYDECRQRMHGSAGAIVTFTGLVRDRFEDDAISSFNLGTLSRYDGVERTVRSRKSE